MNKIYTGVGSRSTPENIIKDMVNIAFDLSKRGWRLRSGGAYGADYAFEQGCDSALGTKEIYLPWKNFNDNPSHHYKPREDAYNLAASVHPSWSVLTFGGKSLHARNCYQILGQDLKIPSDFIICWTKNGELVGGTRTAIKLAEMYKIPVFNMFFTDWRKKLYEFIEHII